MSTLTPPVPFPDTEREFYGEKVVAVEPGGVEFIPLNERHGKPIQLLWTWRPKEGLCQMVLSRTGFGFLGNILPAGLNAVTAGVGWFAVNSISGALALSVLTHMPQVLCLVIIVAVQLVGALFGYNLVHVFERDAFPILHVIFLIAAGVILSKAHP